MNAAPSFLTLARQPDLDQETAYTICRLVDLVGPELVEGWDYDWLDGEPEDYRSLINVSVLEGAWDLLVGKGWLSFQGSFSPRKKLSTITPLDGLLNLRSLILRGNTIDDLKPSSSLVALKRLDCADNRIKDLSSLRNLRSLQELNVWENPIESCQVLEDLPSLRELGISSDQVSAFINCRKLDQLQILRVTGDAAIENVRQFPEMLSLKVLELRGIHDLSGIERYGALECLDLTNGLFSSLAPLERLKALTHLTIRTSKPLSLEPLRGLFALRYLSIDCPRVEGLSALSGLPVLHDLIKGDKTQCNPKDFRALQQGLTPWDSEFQTKRRKDVEPSLVIRAVDQATFDQYDTKMPFGVHAGECNEQMLTSERNWLVKEIQAALSVTFEDGADYDAPYIGGMRRSDRVIIHSIRAYESIREIVTAVQRILCETRNGWIIWCQSLLRESPEEQEVPDDIEDFIMWIYPDKVVTTEKHASVLGKLLGWSR